MDARKDPLNACGVQPEHALQQACEHRPLAGKNGMVAILKKVCLLAFHVFAKDATAIDAASHHPVNATVAMIGAAVAVLAEGAAKFGDHDDHRISPSGRPDLLGKARKRAAEYAETSGEMNGRRVLVDVRL